MLASRPPSPEIPAAGAVSENPASAPPASGESARQLRRMALFLRQASGFRLTVALYNDSLARDGMIGSLGGELSAENLRVVTLDLREAAGERTLLARLETLVANTALAPGERLAVMIVNLESRVEYTPETSRAGGPGLAFLETANLHRDLFPEVCPWPVVLWVSELLENALVRYAPDLWRWRTHRFDVRSQRGGVALARLPNQQDLPNDDFRRHPEDRLRRLAEELAGHRQLIKAGHAEARYDEGRVLNSMGSARAEAGDAKGARLNFLEALEIAREIGDRRAEGNTLSNLGLAYEALSETRKAIGFYEQALEIAREIGDRRGEGIALGNLGTAYVDLAETHKSIDFYEQALEIAREIGNRRSESTTLGNLGNAYVDLGERRKAIGFYEQALEIAREIGNRRGESAILDCLGVDYADLGEARKAIGFHEQALEIAREIGDRRGEGTALGNLGVAYADLGETRKAIGFYEQRLEIARETGDRRGEGNALYNISSELWNTGDRHGAVECLEQSLLIHQETEDPWEENVRARLEQYRAEMQAAMEA